MRDTDVCDPVCVCLPRALSMLGLILIALGTGGIKPCVAAFGGDQFEEHQVRRTSVSNAQHLPA